MNKKTLSVSVYKGENRYLIVPLIRHIGGYSVESKWFVSLPISTELNVLGKCVGEAIQHIKNSPPSTLTPNEIKMNLTWKKNSKYKNWLSFWKNNLLVHVNFDEYEGFTIYSTKRTVDTKGGYYDCIKEILLSHNAKSGEIGGAIKDVFDAADEFYLEKTGICNTKQIQLLNKEVLIVNNLKDVHFYDRQDDSTAEVYQCYCYIPKENVDSSAEIFLGIAAELDCNIAPSNVQSVWEEIYGKADSFEVQEIDYGIFKLRAEMKSKNTHKVSYLLKMEEDLLLECGLDVHQPNKRKKLDADLVQIFESFALGCKLNEN